MPEQPCVITHIAGNHVIQLEIRDAAHKPQWIDVAATIDYARTWTFTEPGWRRLALGVARDHPYLWSARRLIVLPTTAAEEPAQVDVDEDILLVFAEDNGWLIVCETSVRLFEGLTEVSRLELGDVVVHARREHDTLRVLDASARLVDVIIANDKLVSTPAT